MRLLRLNEVITKTALSRATIYRLIRDEKFPAPLKVASKASRWLENEVDEWGEELASER